MNPDPEALDLDDSPEYLRHLLSTIPLAAFVVDEHGLIEDANDFVSGLLGWERRELCGEHFEILVPERFRPTEGQRFETYLQAPGPRLPDSGLDLVLCRKDGTELPVDIAVKPLTRDGSTVTVAVIHDLSARHRAEQELRASEERFRIAASHTVDLIQEIDLQQDRMIYHGDVDHLTGYSPGEFPSTVSGWVDLIHPEDRAAIEAEVEGALSGRVDRWKWRYRLRTADGTYRHLIDHGTFIDFDEDGLPISGLGCVQNVTEEVLRERELQKALAELSTLRDRLAEENVYLREELWKGLGRGEVIGECEPWRRVLAQIRLVAATESTVLLAGETGTGKDLLARALHAESLRQDRTLIKVNCAALPRTLIESELFGHERGAFSGADRQRKGRFEIADGGTLFLDEVGELPLDLQSKMLHVLQSGEFERLGSSKTLKADVRVIAASNRDLAKEVEAGRFRSDLYYRIAVFPIEVPPLRARREDIPLLAMYFLSRQNAKLGKSLSAIPKPAMDALVAYDWPGNVRELENVIERAAIVSVGDKLYVDTAAMRSDQASRELSRPSRAAAAPTEGGVSAASLEDVERAHIVAVLESCGWKVKGHGNAAEQLGLKESTLRSRMKRLGIKRP